MRKVWVLLMLLGLTVGAVAGQDTSVDELGAQLDTLVPTLLEEHQVAGAAIAVIHDGEVAWTQGYGVANLDSAEPVTPDTVFHVASISKAFTAWAILGLVESGDIELDAPVDQYLTRWNLPDSSYNPDDVTIRRILSHTAGLSVDGYEGYEPDEELPTLEQVLLGEGKSARVTVLVTPGVMFRYSGGGYEVLQLLIEEVTGEDYSDYMQETVFAPLGIENSSYELTPEIETNLATGYAGPAVPKPIIRYTEQAAGGLYMTAADLASFVAANVESSETEMGAGIISPESVTLAHTDAEATNGEYGFGLFLYPLEDGRSVVWHDGISAAWRTLFAFEPESGEGIVILTNSSQGDDLYDEILCAWTASTGEGIDDFCEAL
ncbi:MAG: beta-lactamase family protein [Burkholderiales bacterium]|nr:beta-lactamase family protein [Anaerolineae bacterium]